MRRLVKTISLQLVLVLFSSLWRSEKWGFGNTASPTAYCYKTENFKNRRYHENAFYYVFWSGDASLL